MSAQDFPVNMIRSVALHELKTTFRFNNSSETLTLEDLFHGVKPKLLGSFRLDEFKREVALLDVDTSQPIQKIKHNFKPEICMVKPLLKKGISCWSEASFFKNITPLPAVDNEIQSHVKYFLGAGEIDANETLKHYIVNPDESLNATYNDKKISMFLQFMLNAEVDFPAEFERIFDNAPPGHWTISRTNSEPFDAYFCRIGAFYYGMIPDLVDMGWQFYGLTLQASAEPRDYDDSYDRDVWNLAVIIHEYFSCLSTEDIVNDAITIQTDMLACGFARKFCSNVQAILRVIGDIKMFCNEDELYMLNRFKNEMAMHAVESGEYLKVTV
jgi:hypothetical protein